MSKLDPTDPRVTPEKAITAHRDLGRMFNKIEQLRGDITTAALKALPRAMLYHEIERERERQDTQCGGPGHDDDLEWDDWTDFISKQVRKLTERKPSIDLGESIENYRARVLWVGEQAEFRERMVKIAALAVAAIESYDRKARR